MSIRIRQSNFLRHLGYQAELLNHAAVDNSGAVVNEVAAYQHGKHEDSHIVVVFFINVTQTLSVDEDDVDSFAIRGLYRNCLVPDPETLCAGCGLVAHYEATWFTN